MILPKFSHYKAEGKNMRGGEFDDMKLGIGSIIVFVCEAARFRLVFNDIWRQHARLIDTSVHLINNWSVEQDLYYHDRNRYVRPLWLAQFRHPPPPPVLAFAIPMETDIQESGECSQSYDKDKKTPEASTQAPCTGQFSYQEQNFGNKQTQVPLLSAMVDGLGSPNFQRRQLDAGPVSKLGILSKSGEVLIAEDENDNIVPETMKDNGILVQYKVGEHGPFVSELLSGLSTTAADLGPHQIHAFYESVVNMSQAESDPQKRDEYLQGFMEILNQNWAEIIGQTRLCVDLLKDQDVIRTELNILQNDTSIISWKTNLGAYFLSQRRLIFLDMLEVYRYKGVKTEDPHRILEAIFGCTVEMIMEYFEDYPEHHLKFFSMLNAIATHCFPTLICSASQVTQFVSCLSCLKNDLLTFVNHIRDFLVQFKEFSAEDNQDLHTAERDGDGC